MGKRNKDMKATIMGNIGLANRIFHATKNINNLTTDPLAQLFVDGGERCYTKAGNICDVTSGGIKVGKEVYYERTL